MNADTLAVLQTEVANSTFLSENIWIMGCALLVFVMGLGFACVESGLCRAKSCANIMFKNFAVPAIGITLYAFFGFNVMYPDAFSIPGIFGFDVRITGTTPTLRTGSSRRCSPRPPRQSSPAPLRNA